MKRYPTSSGYNKHEGTLAFEITSNLTVCTVRCGDCHFISPSGTNIYMLTLGDFWSSNTIDLYLHRR